MKANKLKRLEKIGNYKHYLDEKIKDKELKATILEIIAWREISCFEDGIKAGKEELQNKFKDLMGLAEQI